ncbi:hypothetical protein CR513_23675, partial [Mucuna pruriens]
MKELLGTLKVHKMELNKNEGKPIAFKAQKAPKGSTSKAFKVEESCGDISHEACSDEDELSFISRKIQSMWKHKRGSRWKNDFKKHTKGTKSKMQAVCYECKKQGNFKSECPNLQKEEEKEKKKSFIKKKKGLMTTLEDLDLSSSKDEDEEANLFLMTNTVFEDEDNEEEIKEKLNIYCSNYRKFGRRSYDCRKHPKGLFKPSRTNPKKPKKIWATKSMIILIVDVFNSKKETLVMVLGQWVLTSLTREEYMFEDLKQKKGGWVIFEGNKKGLESSLPTIDNALYDKGLKHNLPSISQLCDSEYDGQNHMYKIDLRNLTNQNVTCLVSINDDH